MGRPSGLWIATWALIAGIGCGGQVLDDPTLTDSDQSRRHCGDGICQSSESCSTCARDCGMCAAPTPDLSMPTGLGLLFEAEAGLLQAPFHVAGGAVLQDSATMALDGSNGSATYRFTVPADGQYILNARASAANTGANSFFLNLDAQPQAPTMIWDIAPTNGFENRTVSWRGDAPDENDQFAPKVFALTAGVHELILRGREAGAQIDRFAFIDQGGDMCKLAALGILTSVQLAACSGADMGTANPSPDMALGGGQPDLSSGSPADLSEGTATDLGSGSPPDGSMSPPACGSPGALHCWYVDPLASGPNHDGLSWSTAWTHLSDIAGVAGGDTVYISGGPSNASQTYSLSGQWLVANGTANHPITYRIGQGAQHNGTAIFSGQGSWLGTMSNVVITGDAGDGRMHFSLSGYDGVASGDNSSNIRIAYVHGDHLSDALKFNPGTSLEIDHNYFYVSDPNTDRLMYADFQNTGMWDGSRIHDNTVYLPRNSGGEGADGFQAGGEGYSLYNNTIIGYATNYTGGQHQDGWQATGGNYIKIYNNTFLNIANYPIFADAYYSTFSHLRAFNNVLILSDPALQASDPPQGLVVGVGVDGGYIGSLPAIGGDILAANNLVDGYLGHSAGGNSANGSYTMWGKYPMKVGSAAGLPDDILNGNVSVNGGGFCFTNGSNGQGTTCGPMDPDNLTISTAIGSSSFASYVANGNNNDYHLKSTATSLIKKGANLSSFCSDSPELCRDRDGVARPTNGAWDVGPYQYH